MHRPQRAFLLGVLFLLPSSSSQERNTNLRLASNALKSYVKAYFAYGEKRGETVKSDAVTEEDYVFDYYEIGTAEETMPDVNWTMLRPKYPELRPWRPDAFLSRSLRVQIIENNLLGDGRDEVFPGFKRGFRPSLLGQCGLPGPAKQIVGGDEATANSFPWMAALFVDSKVGDLTAVTISVPVFLWGEPDLGGVGAHSGSLCRRRRHRGDLLLALPSIQGSGSAGSPQHQDGRGGR